MTVASSRVSRTTRQRRRALPLLLGRVAEARELEHAQTHPRAHLDPLAVRAAQQATLQALLDYAAAIEELAWPVPRRIQLEIRMRQNVCGSPGRSAPR